MGNSEPTGDRGGPDPPGRGEWVDAAGAQRRAFTNLCPTAAASVFRDPGTGRTWKKKLRWLGSMLWADRPQGRFLEVGTGEGFLHGGQELYPERCVFFDVADAALTRARSRWTEATRLPAPGGVAGYAEELPFRDQSFDGVFGVDVLHHLSCRPKAVSEMVRVLRPGGRLAFVEPNPRYPAALLQLLSPLERGIWDLRLSRIRSWTTGTGVTELVIGEVPIFFPSFPRFLESLYQQVEAVLGRTPVVRGFTTSRTVSARRATEPATDS